ncbi:DUF6816 family protein [Synechocystis salina]|uniref:DUF6816 family protein n=1 Tax=Synechocystis salina TaxID=945780 RepID=UPI001D145A08|nr:hypothetical protein [Synechocystis salina]
MSRFLVRLTVLFLCNLLWLVAGRAPALAESLPDRWDAYPHWSNLPTLEQRKGEIHYPEWFAGTWQVTSTLTEQLAPLAPDIVSPGFAKNGTYLEQPVEFPVRFIDQTPLPEFNWALSDLVNNTPVIVPDRRFNAEAITQAYLGKDREDINITVQVKEQPSPRLVTVFPQHQRLVSTVLGYSQSSPDPDHFLATELTNQQFIAGGTQYLNQVETTTAYHHLGPGKISASQVTAVYLSPTDPDYFAAGHQPIALYRYELTLEALPEP